MSTTIEKTPQREDVDNPTNMVHRLWLDDPTVAWCGAKLQGIVMPGATTECVVCAEIEASR